MIYVPAFITVIVGTVGALIGIEENYRTGKAGIALASLFVLVSGFIWWMVMAP
jgi:hypothetical protein